MHTDHARAPLPERRRGRQSGAVCGGSLFEHFQRTHDAAGVLRIDTRRRRRVRYLQPREQGVRSVFGEFRFEAHADGLVTGGNRKSKTTLET